ncbi:protease inhibitor I9 family protein [Marinobacter sp. SS21]|uniref:protease inhibitor I9 family protein n=1 Tax=Marinobacter sp. SS21 TaxID=2979460 RepID=UPI00232A88E0|nr:protease inhibitor I9 family protein [Marinobacter sp. SS21]MDC0662776.1 hypothetical protein [Marinobacter sp. SS21]
MTRNIVLGLVVGLLVACATVGAMAQPPERDRYIVVLDPNAGAPAAVAEALARRHNGQVGFVYQHALQGFSIALPPQTLSGLRRDGRIKYLERDDPVQPFDQITPTGLDHVVTVSALTDFDGRSGGNGTATCRSDQDDTPRPISETGATPSTSPPRVSAASSRPIRWRKGSTPPLMSSNSYNRILLLTG